jgi:hypothetical protein
MHREEQMMGRISYRRRKTAVIGFVFMAAVFANAATIVVPSSGVLTIGMAMIKAKAGDTIFAGNAVFTERVFVKSGTSLIARNDFKSIIDAGGRGTAVTLGKNALIQGFEIRNATIGVFSNGAGCAIVRCRIIGNWQSGIIIVRHLPKIEDNIIVFNRASGIQGWDVRSTVASINHNTISFNQNHGIAMGGKSNVIIENNIIAFNERYGLKISEESKNSEISKNNFYRNLTAAESVPDGNFSFDPAFISPRAALNFNPNPKLCCKIKGSDNENLGSRY